MAKIIRKLTKHRKLLIAVVVIVAVSIGLAIRHFHKSVSIIPSAHSSVSQSSSKLPAASNGSTNSSAAASSPKNSSVPQSIPSQVNLSAPSGSFVSNHQADSSTQEESVCNTVQGATCYIEFTNGDSTKKLDSQIAGSDGSLYWNWSVAQAGLDNGSWTVTAVTSLNGQIRTTTDQLKLEVQL